MSHLIRGIVSEFQGRTIKVQSQIAAQCWNKKSGSTSEFERRN